MGMPTPRWADSEKRGIRRRDSIFRASPGHLCNAVWKITPHEVRSPKNDLVLDRLETPARTTTNRDPREPSIERCDEFSYRPPCFEIMILQLGPAGGAFCKDVKRHFQVL